MKYFGARRNPSPRKITHAIDKTAKVQGDLAKAEADLHVNNDKLSGELATAEAVGAIRAVVAQNVKIEGQLHAAADELGVVKGMLRDAEAELADRSHHSGQGTDSIMDQLRRNSR